MEQGWLYFAGDLDGAEVVKIGWTGRPDWQTRLYALASVYPFELKPLLIVAGTMHEESQVLSYFRNSKTKNGRGEWFYATEMLLAFIEWMKGHAWPEDEYDFRKQLGFLHGRPNQLDPEIRLAAARTVTR